jgi:hypothetical protein
MAKLGITHQALGITGHGLRHEYANDLYEKETGVMPPLRGGTVVDRPLDRDARLKIAQELGHGRIQIVGTYCGKRTSEGQPSACPTLSESDSNE